MKLNPIPYIIGFLVATMFVIVGVGTGNLNITSQPSPATIPSNNLYLVGTEPPPTTSLSPCKYGTKIQNGIVNVCNDSFDPAEINARLDALDGDKVKKWQCHYLYLNDKTLSDVDFAPESAGGGMYIQTIGKETPQQLGYSDCTQLPWPTTLHTKSS